MNYTTLTCTVDAQGVAEVILNRPEVHNAFNLTLINELTQCFARLETDPKVRLIALSGNGPSFSAGADLNWMRSMKDYSLDENREDSRLMADMFLQMYDCTKPILAYCHGNVLGGGMGLLAVCDYVLANRNTRFGFTETRLGLVPAVISPFVVNKIGESNARAFFISGTKFDAQKAMNMNLVHELVEDGPESVKDARSRMIQSFLKAAPEAASQAKRLIRDVVKLNRKVHREDLITYTVNTIAELRVSEEAQEGMDALLSKRKASWM